MNDRIAAAGGLQNAVATGADILGLRDDTGGVNMIGGGTAAEQIHGFVGRHKSPPPQTDASSGNDAGAKSSAEGNRLLAEMLQASQATSRKIQGGLTVQIDGGSIAALGAAMRAGQPGYTGRE
jgi:hypothetical protein